MSIAEARKFAMKAHDGQVDRAGVPYFNHVEAVAEITERLLDKSVISDLSAFVDTISAAYLHDVVEDCGVSIDEIREKFGPRVAAIVFSLTKNTEELYSEFIERVSGDMLAAIVKLADLEHNSDLSRLDKITPVDRERADRYMLAMKYLEFKCFSDEEL